jgi:hypothetical protein
LSTVAIPAHLARDARRFAADFDAVTRAWIVSGAEGVVVVEYWRAVIRLDMAADEGVDPAIDPRPREERIEAWCKTFGSLAKQGV